MRLFHKPQEVVDLFAGPGGWDVAARELGLDVIGIEFDRVACETRRAAGLATIEGDVRNYGLENFPNARGLIASPPCQTFSMAGNGAGRKALDDVFAGIDSLAVIRHVESEFSDERTALVLEPLRWILAAIDAGRPFEWIALEQVPTVLPVWERYASLLRALGYSVATGNIQAEQYGVPQTRKRAVLMARRDGEAKLPTPTHSKYYSRTPDKLDAGVLKWVSMSEALGWEPDGYLRSNYGTGGDPRNRGERSLNAPAATVTSKIDRYKWMRRNSGPGAAREPRPVDHPAYTIRANGSGSHPSGVEWVYRGSNQAHAARRPLDTPAPTVNFAERSNKVEWMPADEAADPKASGVRVAVEEAAILQSFPADYPWRGPKTKQYQQVGNAIPPQLAKAVLAVATSAHLASSTEAAA